jgi:hypothetical protein
LSFEAERKVAKCGQVKRKRSEEKVILKSNCPHCGQGIEFDSQDSGRQCDCPTCNGTFELPVSVANIRQEVIRVAELAPQIQYAAIESKTDSSGGGCLIQGIGLLLCFTIVGAIVGIPIILCGGMMARYKSCSNCGTKLNGKPEICPACKCKFR